MNTLQIRYFMSAVECRSMSKAAEMFFVSQPAMSKQIRNLEQELGVVLLKRSSSGVVLTEAGKLIYSHFSAMNQEFKMLLDEAKRLSGNEVTTLRIGVPEDWDISRFTHDVKRTFSQRHPQVVINTACQNNLMNMVSLLRDNCYDILFLPFVPATYLEGITTVRVTEVPMAIVASTENPICRKETLCPEDFRNELFLVTGHEGFDIAKRSMYKYLEPYKFTPEIETRSSMSSVIQGVLNNEGVTLRDVWSLSISNPNLRSVEMNAVQSVYLAYRTEDNSEPLCDFVRLVLDYFAQAEERSSQ